MDNPGYVGEQTSQMPGVQSDEIELIYTADQVVEQYISLRNAVKDIKKRHAAELEPYNAAMELLEGYAAAMMRKIKTTLSTPHGSAFWVRAWSYKVVDFDAFFAWVVKNKQKQMMTRHVSKEGLEAWIEVQEALIPANEKIEGKMVALPPGIQSDYIVTVQFRKA